MALYFGDGGGEVFEAFGDVAGVGEDVGERGLHAAADGEDDFEHMGGNGDLVWSDGCGLAAGAGDHAESVVAGEVELAVLVTVSGLVLRNRRRFRANGGGLSDRTGHRR